MESSHRYRVTLCAKHWKPGSELRNPFVVFTFSSLMVRETDINKHSVQNGDKGYGEVGS